MNVDDVLQDLGLRSGSARRERAENNFNRKQQLRAALRRPGGAAAPAEQAPVLSTSGLKVSSLTLRSARRVLTVPLS